MNLGGRIKQRREHLRLTQEDVAKEVSRLAGGVVLSQQALSNLEARDSKKSDFVYELAVVLKTTPKWLMRGIGDPDELGIKPDLSDEARFVAEHYDSLRPIQKEMIREIFMNRGPDGSLVGWPDNDEKKGVHHAEERSAI